MPQQEASNPGPATRLRVLVLDEYFPYPPDSGKPIRTWNLLQRLATRHDITFLCHGHLTAEQQAAALRAGIRVETVDAIPPASGLTLYMRLLLNVFSPYPYSVSKHYTTRLRSRLLALLKGNSFEVVHCEWTPYARYIGGSASPPVVIATHNIESQIWERRAQHASNALSGLFFSLQAAKMKRFEQQALAAAAMVTTVSALDARQARDWGARRAMVVDNGVDLVHFSPRGDGDADRAVFVGSLDWFPNVDAVHYFADEILPVLNRLAPTIHTKIIGRRAPASLSAALVGKVGLDFVGEVPDTRPQLADAGIVIVPLRIGGGSRLKILEALSMGKAVVSTTIGAEGLDVTDRKNILLADSADAFARAMMEVASSPSLRRELGSQGRLLVEKQYGWDTLSLKAERAWRDVAAQAGAV